MKEVIKKRKKERKKDIRKCLEANDHENNMVQSLCDAAKGVILGKFRVIQYYVKKHLE